MMFVSNCGNSLDVPCLNEFCVVFAFVAVELYGTCGRVLKKSNKYSDRKISFNQFV